MKPIIKTILIILVLGIVLSGFFISKINPARNFLFSKVISSKIWAEKIIKEIKNEFIALGQDLSTEALYFFPSYPQRLMYIAAEISQASQELAELNQELADNIAQCDCSLAESQCVSFQSGQIDLFKALTDQIKESIKAKINAEINSATSKINQQLTSVQSISDGKINDLQAQVNKQLGDINSRIETLQSQLGQKSDTEINAEIRNINSDLGKLDILVTQQLGQASSLVGNTINDLQTMVNGKVSDIKEKTIEQIKASTQGFKPRTLATKETEEQLIFWQAGLTEFVIEELAGKLQALESEEIKEGAFQENNAISQEEKKGKTLAALSDETIQSKINALNSKSAQIQSFTQSKSSEISSQIQASRDSLIKKLGVFGDILNKLTPCEPGPLGVFGDPCPNREDIEDTQLKITEKAQQIVYLKNLLTKEMETGLDRELLTLRPEVAFDLQDNLLKILNESEKIVLPANNNSQLPDNCFTATCSPDCLASQVFKLEACLMIGTGVQRTIDFNFKAGVKLDNLKLGQVGINKVNLNLPEEMQLSKLDNLEITIPSQLITVTFPQIPIANLLSTQIIDLSSQDFSFSPNISLPQVPSLNFSCAQFSASSPSQCTPVQKKSVADIENSWYWQAYSYLSENCQGLPEMTGDTGLTEKAKDCFNPEKVITATISGCNNAWAAACAQYPVIFPSQKICKEIRGDSCQGETLIMEAATQCQNLFNLEKEPVPQSCQPTISVAFLYNQKNPNFDPVTALKNKCAELKDKERKEAPEPCKLLPLFLGKIPEPKPLQFSANQASCSSQNIGDYPTASLDCPVSFPSIPKISFPQIIIPDITMPNIKIWPFLELKLPNFIFEDLTIPDLNLCNLDNCENIFPNLAFSFPFLTLPKLDLSLHLPDLDSSFQGIPIKIPLPTLSTNINLPAIPFGTPSLPQLSFTPELSLPQFSLPRPQITFAFSGVDLDGIFSLIASFLLNAMDIPDYTFCKSFQLGVIPLRLIYPDYYFSWPAFPEIPEIPFCQDIISFCKEAKAALKEVTNKTSVIEKELSKVLSEQVQAKLNALSQKINNYLTTKINETLQGYSQVIKSEIKKRLDEALKSIESAQEGMLTIPPLDISLPEKKITIPLGNMSQLPDKIKIPWAKELMQLTLSTPLVYDLPEIPLSKLSYGKDIPIKGPGFQPRTLELNLGNLGNLAECQGATPSGGNPCPLGNIKNNLDNIRGIQKEIDEASQNIIHILE